MHARPASITNAAWYAETNLNIKKVLENLGRVLARERICGSHFVFVLFLMCYSSV